MDKVDLLCELYQAKFDRLKEMASVSDLPKNGPVEVVRARLIKNLVLSEWDLSKESIKSIKNKRTAGTGALRAPVVAFFFDLFMLYSIFQVLHVTAKSLIISWSC